MEASEVETTSRPHEDTGKVQQMNATNMIWYSTFLQKIDQNGVITAEVPEETDQGTGPDAQGHLTGTGNITIVGGVGAVIETGGLGIDTTGDTNYSVHIDRSLCIPYTPFQVCYLFGSIHIWLCVSLFQNVWEYCLVRAFVPLSAC